MTPFELGRQNADLFLGFSCYIKDQADQAGIRDLYFCTREGFFFKKVFDALFEDQAGYPGINTRMLSVSRQSVFPVSILEADGPDFSNLFRLYKTHSPRSFLKSLGLSSGESLRFFSDAGLDVGELVTSSQDVETFSSVLADTNFVALVESGLRAEKASVLGYFSAEFEQRNQLAIVDIGWRATVLAALARLYPDRQFMGFYLGLAHERNTFGRNTEKYAYGPDFDRSVGPLELLHAVDVLEFICLSPSSSVAGYQQRTDQGFEPVEAPESGSSEQVRAFSEPFQKGVVAVARETDPDSAMSSHKNGKLRESAMTCWKSLLSQPDPKLVSAFFAFKSDESFGLAETRNQSDVPAFSDVMVAIFSAERRAKIKRYLIYNQWAKGMLNRRDLGIMKRSFWYCIMKVAEGYKHSSQHGDKGSTA